MIIVIVVTDSNNDRHILFIVGASEIKERQENGKRPGPGLEEVCSIFTCSVFSCKRFAICLEKSLALVV